MKNEQQELQLLLRSRFPVLVVETAEEQRFLRLVETVANLEETALFTWSVVKGLCGSRVGTGVPATRELVEVLAHLVKSPQNGLFVFLDAQPFLEHPGVIRMIREIAFEHTRLRQTLVFVGTHVALHPDLQRMSASFRMAPIGPEEVKALIKEEAELFMFQREVNLGADRIAYDMLVQHLVGLSRDDARRMIRQSIEHEGAITMDDVARVLRLKHESMGQGGTLQMVTELGTLLTWMSERRDRVFLMATANDIEALPPELLRKGRFDEIFFVDLPDAPTRADIFRIHLAKRSHPVERFALPELAAASERFSGAEIEQAIVAGAYAAHSEKKALETRHVLQELGATKPLAVVRAEHVAALRRWADGRTVAAD